MSSFVTIAVVALYLKYVCTCGQCLFTFLWPEVLSHPEVFSVVCLEDEVGVVAVATEDAAVGEHPVVSSPALVITRIVDEEREVNRIFLACGLDEAEQFLAGDEHPLVAFQVGIVHVGINYIERGSEAVITVAEAEQSLAASFVCLSCIGCFLF